MGGPSPPAELFDVSTLRDIWELDDDAERALRPWWLLVSPKLGADAAAAAPGSIDTCLESISAVCMVCRAFWGERSDWSSPFEPAAVICDNNRGKLANDMGADDEVGVEEGLACCVLGNEVALCLLPPGKQR